jgi:hypothetical protein
LDLAGEFFVLAFGFQVGVVRDLSVCLFDVAFQFISTTCPPEERTPAKSFGSALPLPNRLALPESPTQNPEFPVLLKETQSLGNKSKLVSCNARLSETAVQASNSCGWSGLSRKKHAGS